MRVGDVKHPDHVELSPLEERTTAAGFSEQAHLYRGRDLPNAMTVDVEDYFQVSAFENAISRDEWASIPARLPRNIEKILELFEQEDVKATFFTLG